MANPEQTAEITGWLVASARLTFFSSTDVEGKAVFEKASGAMPTTSVVDNQEKTETHFGEIGRHEMRLAKTRFLTDRWRYDVNLGGGYPPACMSRDELLAVLPGVAYGVATALTAIHRLAVGCDYRLRRESPAAGYQTLDVLLPGVKVDYTKGSDFLYRINRFTEVQFGGHQLRINRLTTWASISMVENVFTSDAQQLNNPPGYFVQLQTDMNTAPKIDLHPMNFRPDHIVALCGILENESFRFTKGDLS